MLGNISPWLTSTNTLESISRAMIPFAQLRRTAIQHENTSLEIPFYGVMHTVTRNSRCIAHSDSTFRVIGGAAGAKLTSCSWYLTRLNIAYARDRNSQQVGELKSFPSGRRAAEWLLSASGSQQSGVSFYSIRDCELSQFAERGIRRKSRRNFSTASKFTLPERLALSPDRGDIDWNTKQKLRPCVSRAFNEFTCQPNSFLKSALPGISKGHVVSGSISRRINVDNAISQATSGANIFAFHATFYTDWGQQ